MQITRLDARYAVSPQIFPADVPEIAAAGFTGLINNRPDGEAPDQPAAAEIEAAAKAHGLAYWHIPVTPAGLSEADARRLAEVLRGIGGPVLAFCRSGARSTNIWKAAQQIS